MAPVDEVGIIRLFPVLPFPFDVLPFSLRKWFSRATPKWPSTFTVLVPKDK